MNLPLAATDNNPFKPVLDFFDSGWFKAGVRLLLFLIGVMYVALVLWTYKDARRRIGDPAARTTTITGLASGETYDIEIVSVSGSGTTFPAINVPPATDTTPPALWPYKNTGSPGSRDFANLIKAARSLSYSPTSFT